MPPSSVHAWRSDPDEVVMCWRILDIHRPPHLPIEKLTLLPTGKVQYSTIDGHMIQTTVPHGWWDCVFDTTIDISFNFRNTEVILGFQMLDNSDCYQERRTKEVILVPWNENPEVGPTVRSLAQSQLLRQQQGN
jgi:hypothetical protein